MVNVVYLAISLIYFVPLKYSQTYYVGDFCILQSTGALGQCQLLHQCQPAIQALQARVFPQICGFPGLELAPIVCCSGSAPVVAQPPSITITTKRTDPTIKPTTRPTTAATRPTTLGVLRVGEKSRPKKCYTPEMQEGRCIPLYDCPEVLKAFNNPPKGSETYLRKYICKDGEGIEVCCDNSNTIMMLAEQHLLFDSPLVLRKDVLPECLGKEPYENVLPEILAKHPESGVEYVKCFGALINKRYVITAAECVAQNDNSQESSTVGVQFTSSKRSYFFGVEEEIRHPFYDPASRINDLGLLRLNGTVFRQDGVRLYLCIETYTSLKRKELATYYGLNFNASTGEQWHKRTFILSEFLSTDLCREMLKNKNVNAVVTEYDICPKEIGNSTEITCNKYAGSPLIYNSEHDNIRSNQHDLLFAISSSKIGCADGLPNVYTNLYSYRLWLRDNMRSYWDDNEQCRTPSGDAGQTLPIYYCPALMEIFSYARNGTRAYLDKIIIRRGDYTTGIFHVCCPKSLNSSIAENRNVLPNIDVPPEFLDERCGMQHRDDYFSSSTALAIDEFPWIASIVCDCMIRYPIDCGGVLINARYVLTTANCMRDTTANYTIVRLGDFTSLKEEHCVKDVDIDGTDCTGTEYFGVEDIISHPFYVSDLDLNNVALIRLNKTVLYTDFIRPICLPVQGTVTAKPGETMYMSGWAASVRGGTKLKFVTRLLSYNECQRILRTDSKNYIHADTMCTRDYENTTTDYVYGAALMFSNNYQWHVEGVFHNGFLGSVSRYANVSKYVNWILENMRPWK